MSIRDNINLIKNPDGCLTSFAQTRSISDVTDDLLYGRRFARWDRAEYFVESHNPTHTYYTNDKIIRNTATGLPAVWRARTDLTPRPFNAADWELVSTAGADSASWASSSISSSWVESASWAGVASTASSAEAFIDDFSTASTYKAGDKIVATGSALGIWRATASVSPGAFDIDNWELIATSASGGAADSSISASWASSSISSSWADSCSFAFTASHISGGTYP
jgi:hypothetical protein